MIQSELFLNLLIDPLALDDVDLKDLEAAAERYPYAERIQLFYIRKMQKLGINPTEKAWERLGFSLSNTAADTVLGQGSLVSYAKSRFLSWSKVLDDSVTNVQQSEIEPVLSNCGEKEALISEHLDEAEEAVLTDEIQEIVTVTDVDSVEEDDTEDRLIKEDQSEELERSTINSVIETTVEIEASACMDLEESLSVPISVEIDDVRAILGVKVEKKAVKKEKQKAKKKKGKRAQVQRTDVSFADWLLSLHDEPKQIKKKKGKAKKKKKKGTNKIDTFTVRRKGVVSETLAALMVAQGKKIEAISIYEELKLKYPEKSVYFADLIKKVKEDA